MRASDIKKQLVWDWLRPDLVKIGPEDRLEQAAQLMQNFQIHHLVVMKEQQVVGILEASDMAGQWDRTIKVKDRMVAGVPVIDEKASVREVLRAMLDHQVTALPLKRGDEVSGVLTQTDLVRLLGAHLTSPHHLSDLVERGVDLLSKPMIQSLMNLLNSAGI